MKKVNEKPKASLTIKLDPEIKEVVQNVITELDRICHLIEKVIEKGIITSSK